MVDLYRLLFDTTHNKGGITYERTIGNPASFRHTCQFKKQGNHPAFSGASEN